MALVADCSAQIRLTQSGVLENILKITDTSNYGINGYDVNDYVVNLRITFNGLEIHYNTDYNNPDITVGGGYKEFPLVADSDDNFIAGDYVVYMYVKNTDTNNITEGNNTFDFDYVQSVVSITITADGYASTFKSVDSTDYGSNTYTRSHTVEVPDGSGISDTTTTNAEINYTANIWSGVYECTVTSQISYTNGDLTVLDEIEGVETTTVLYINQANIYEAIEDLNTLYNQSLGSNPKLSTTYGILSNRVDGYIRDYNRAIDEQDTTKAYDSISAIGYLLFPDYVSSLFTSTEEIIPYDFTLSTDAQIIAFINAIEASTDDLNKIQGLDVSAGRIVHGDGAKMVTSDDLKFVNGNIEIATGKSLLRGGVNIDNVFAPINSPVFTGVPETTTPSLGDNTKKIASTEFVRAEIAALVDSAPSTLDTLNELAAALGEDPNFATTVSNALGTKAPINNPSFTGAQAEFAGNINLAAGKKYKIGNTDLAYSDVGAQQLNQKLTDISGLTLAEGDILYVNSSGNIVKLVKGTSGSFLSQNGNVPSWTLMTDSPFLVNKVASANIRNSHDAEVNTANGTYTKVKTITFTKGLIGQQRISFRMKTLNYDGNIPSAKICRNGTLIGSEQTTGSSSYVLKSQDITQTWEAGDTCELWIKASTLAGEERTMYVDQFRISYDDSPIVAVPSSNS